jgi:hypothetical protein
MTQANELGDTTVQADEADATTATAPPTTEEQPIATEPQGPAGVCWRRVKVSQTSDETEQCKNKPVATKINGKLVVENYCSKDLHPHRMRPHLEARLEEADRQFAGHRFTMPDIDLSEPEKLVRQAKTSLKLEQNLGDAYWRVGKAMWLAQKARTDRVVDRAETLFDEFGHLSGELEVPDRQNPGAMRTVYIPQAKLALAMAAVRTAMSGERPNHFTAIREGTFVINAYSTLEKKSAEIERQKSERTSPEPSTDLATIGTVPDLPKGKPEGLDEIERANAAVMLRTKGDDKKPSKHGTKKSGKRRDSHGHRKDDEDK